MLLKHQPSKMANVGYRNSLHKAQLSITATSAEKEKMVGMFGFQPIYNASMIGRPSVKFHSPDSSHCCRGDTGDDGDFDGP